MGVINKQDMAYSLEYGDNVDFDYSVFVFGRNNLIPIFPYLFGYDTCPLASSNLVYFLNVDKCCHFFLA